MVKQLSNEATDFFREIDNQIMGIDLVQSSTRAHYMVLHIFQVKATNQNKKRI